MVISVYKEMSLEGYGRTHIPIKPGNHHLEVNLGKPKASSLLGYLGSFFGYQPELLQPKILATTAGNNCKWLIWAEISDFQLFEPMRPLKNCCGFLSEIKTNLTKKKENILNTTL